MRLLRSCAILLLAFSAYPAAAQGIDLTAWASWVELDSQEFEDPEFDIDLEFDSAVGFGVSANWFWLDRFSTELAAMSLESDAELRLSGPDFPEAVVFELGSLDLTPLMLTVQAHWNPDARLDPYLGLGAAYVLIDDLAGDPRADIEPVEIDDEFTFLVNAGVGISVTPKFGLTFDARYLPLEPAAKAINDPEEVDLELNPLIFSAGLRWRF